MHVRSILTPLLAPAVSLTPLRCGTRDPTSSQIQSTHELFKAEKAGLTSGMLDSDAALNVDVYFHVVAASTDLSDGYLTDKMLSDQFEVMNSTFSQYGIYFTLKETDRTINPDWASDTGNEMEMKEALRKGTYQDLNLYFMKELEEQAFGYCYFPVATSNGTDDFIRDGCSILYSTVPGGSMTNYNLGHTVTHEVGHWFNLYHTFQGGCSGSGDMIDDTPAQASPTSGCPEGRDSCPIQAGLDPIHNFMDYSYDPCYTEFTPDQRTRMYNSFEQFRATS